MTKQEFNRVFLIAKSGQDLTLVDDTVLDGIGLPGFQRVSVTARAAAKFMRWHCQMLNGEWDAEALNVQSYLYRLRVDLVD